MLSTNTPIEVSIKDVTTLARAAAKVPGRFPVDPAKLAEARKRLASLTGLEVVGLILKSPKHLDFFGERS